MIFFAIAPCGEACDEPARGNTVSVLEEKGDDFVDLLVDDMVSRVREVRQGDLDDETREIIGFVTRRAAGIVSVVMTMHGELVSGEEANLLLSALDHYLGVGDDGKLRSTVPGFTLEAAQVLRDRLFAAHEHTVEDDQTYEGET